MRQIKFRARRIDNGKWVYGHYFKTPLTDENSGTTPDKGWFFLTGESRHCIESDGVVYVVDPETLGEFTGRHDKNGIEVYEDDIWRDIDGYLYYITWGEHTFKFFAVQVQLPMVMIGLDSLKDGNVLSNIHEHPELLR